MSSLMLADGANNTDVSLARSIVSFSPETVQEFTVQTSAFSAEAVFRGSMTTSRGQSGQSFAGSGCWCDTLAAGSTTRLT